MPKKMSNCRYCRNPLNESRYRQNREYKSCPKCSTEDGAEHVYYPYPSSFGTTPLRATPNTPDGAQSYCTRCRSREVGPFPGGRRCSDF